MNNKIIKKVSLRHGLWLTPLVLFSLLTASVSAADLAPFKKRFQFVRDDQGQLVKVKDNSIRMKFSIAPYLQFIKSGLQQEQALMKSKSDYEGQVKALFEGDQTEKLYWLR
jgi:hypothetical protein